MASSSSLFQELRVFPCPVCKETINTSMQTCPFCSSPIDSAAATIAAEETSRISQACSDASYLKVLGGLAFILLALNILNVTGIVFTTYLFIVFPGSVIRWWIKYGSIKTTDPDYAPAKQSATYAAIGAAIIVLFIIAKLLLLLIWR